MAKDFDGVVRRHPCNVKGFDYEEFNRVFKLKVDCRQPVKTLRKAFLRVVKTKYEEEGHRIISGLLAAAWGLRSQAKEKAGTDSD